MQTIPTGTVTFVFTDIEGSTSRWEHDPEQMQRNFTHQEKLLRETFSARGGYVYKMIGDAFQVAFTTAPIALRAVVDAQQRLGTEAWEGAPIRVRMALHTGVTEERGDDFVGPALNRVARLLSAGHGGQVLLTQVTYELVRDDLPPGVSLLDAGTHRLKDLIRPEHIYQVNAPGMVNQFPPLKTLDTYSHNLPIQLTSFVGREKEMTEVKRIFTAQQGAAQQSAALQSADSSVTARLVTLTGPGGTGKTRLSLHVAADLLENFPDGVWLVELAPLTDSALIPQTIATVLGLREVIGKSTLQMIIEHLRQKHILLILDNCEHLVEACARVADTLLHNCPSVYILASSRELLGIGGELPYRVPSLATPDTNPLPPVETLPQFDAVRLFIERATTASPSFTVTNSNAPDIAEICHRLDGIPLAIELVAARVSLLSIEQIAVRLDNSFRLLTGGSRTAMPRHQTLRALIDWSYDMLPQAEKTLLQRLSVFMSGWTLEAAEEICSDPENEPAGDMLVDRLDIMDLLSQLVNKSLVQVERAEPHAGQAAARYRLLGTIRQYAHEKLIASASTHGNEGWIRGQHMRYYLSLADRPVDVLRGPEQAAWIQRFEVEIDNLRGSLEAAQKTDIESGLRAASAMLWFWLIRGYAGEGMEWLVRLLAEEQAQRGGQAATPQRAIARAHALNAAGFIRCAFEEGCAGQVLLEESLALLQGVNAPPEKANAYLNLGRFAASEQAKARALDLFEQALALYREARQGFGTAECLSELGILATSAGDFQKAGALLEECLSLRRSLGDKDGIAFCLTSLSELAFAQGNLERAIQIMQESYIFYIQAGNRIFKVSSLEYLSLLYSLIGENEHSIKVYDEYIAAGTSPSHYHRKGDRFIRLGKIELAQGHYETAARYLNEALVFGQQNHHDGFICEALLDCGRLAWAQGDYNQAIAHLQESLHAAQNYDEKGLTARVYCELARAYFSTGNPTSALAYLRQALPLFQMPFFRWASVLGLEMAITLAVYQQQYEQAACLYGAAERMAVLTQRFHSPAEWANLVANVAQTRAALGEERFEQTKTEGQKLSLEQAAVLFLDSK
jgi:predicted ATPase/class 3 adenylate cyclase